MWALNQDTGEKETDPDMAEFLKKIKMHDVVRDGDGRVILCSTSQKYSKSFAVNREALNLFRAEFPGQWVGFYKADYKKLVRESDLKADGINPGRAEFGPYLLFFRGNINRNAL